MPAVAGPRSRAFVLCRQRAIGNGSRPAGRISRTRDALAPGDRRRRRGPALASPPLARMLTSVSRVPLSPSWRRLSEDPELDEDQLSVRNFRLAAVMVLIVVGMNRLFWHRLYDYATRNA